MGGQLAISGVFLTLCPMIVAYPMVWRHGWTRWTTALCTVSLAGFSTMTIGVFLL